VFEDGTIKITFNYSGENNTVTLTDLTAAEGGEVFGRCASCSTKKARAPRWVPLLFWRSTSRIRTPYRAA